MLGAWVMALIPATALTQLDLPGWSWRVGARFALKDMDRPGHLVHLAHLPLAALTVWHWRQTMRRHIAVPPLSAVVGLQLH